ncbi:MAG: cell division ATP-binding protein FtsE [Nitrospinota bacterium]
MIKLYHVHKKYGSVQTLTDITLHVRKGEFLYITGPSGAGKTTLLDLIFCSISSDQGQILVNGRNVLKLKESRIPFYRRNIGMIFQDFKLLKQKTVFQNVAFVQRVLGQGGKLARRKVWQTLKDVGLAQKKDHFPRQLSGGEQQRVAIARAVIHDPEIILADEPTGNLDFDITVEIIKLFKEFNRRGTTVVMATHNREIINSFRARTITLERGRVVGDSNGPSSMLSLEE